MHFHQTHNQGLRMLFLTGIQGLSGVPSTLGTDVPGHPQKHLTQTLIVSFVKKHFSAQILDCEKSTE